MPTESPDSRIQRILEDADALRYVEAHTAQGQLDDESRLHNDARDDFLARRVESAMGRLAPPESRRRQYADRAAKWVSRNDSQRGETDVYHVLGSETAAESGDTPWRDEIMMIDEHLPDVTRDAGSVRSVELMKILMSLGFTVSFRSYQPDSSAALINELTSLGISVVDCAAPIREVLIERGKRLCALIVSRPDPLWNLERVIRETVPDVPLIYDTVDLHFLRANAEDALGKSPMNVAEAERLRIVELAMAVAADATVVVADSEAKLLKELVPGVTTYTIPTIHHVTNLAARTAGRSGLLFVGNFNHRPNVDAIEWLAIEILPLILDQEPETVCRIIGSNMSSEIRSLARPGLEIVGHVSDLDPLYAMTRLTVAPLRFGAGIKGKVGESAAFGVPTVGTTIAFDGFEFEDQKECRIADDAASFANAVVNLLWDDTTWLAMSRSAKIAVDARCGPTEVENTIRKMFVDLKIAVVNR